MCSIISNHSLIGFEKMYFFRSNVAFDNLCNCLLHLCVPCSRLQNVLELTNSIAMQLGGGEFWQGTEAIKGLAHICLVDFLLPEGRGWSRWGCNEKASSLYEAKNTEGVFHSSQIVVCSNVFWLSCYSLLLFFLPGSKFSIIVEITHFAAVQVGGRC